MSLYNVLIRPFIKNRELFRASRTALKYYKLASHLPFTCPKRKIKLDINAFGLSFDSPIALGSGIDTKAVSYNTLYKFGSSYALIGPLKRDEIKHKAIEISKCPPKKPLAICITEDYLNSFTLAYDFCDFFVIDITSDPSTEYLDPLLESRIAEEYKPIIVKIPQYINIQELTQIVNYCLLNSVDGIEAQDIKQIKQIREISKGLLPIIADCEIDSVEKAFEALNCGASFIDLSYGLVNKGLNLIKDIQKALIKNESNTIQNSPSS